MSELGQSLKVVLADTFTSYMRAHFYHFCVEGSLFYSDHKLFQKIYEGLFEEVDTIGEHIRALDEYAPLNYKRLMELTTIEDDSRIPTASVMITNLLATLEQVKVSVKSAIEQAKLANDEGVVNYLGGLCELLDKNMWMLRASSKSNRS
jgi:starvation-inducible DNA-binding protein